MSAHLAKLPKTFATDEIRIETTDTAKFGIVEKATAYLQEQGLDVNTSDGARRECPYGWGLRRVANTSPMLPISRGSAASLLLCVRSSRSLRARRTRALSRRAQP